VSGNFSGTLGVPQDLPAVSLSQEEGLLLKADVDAGTTTVDLDVIAIDYATFSGTSASAPHVSGVAALVLSEDPSLSSDEVRRMLRGTAADLGEAGRDNRFGWGLVNAEAAVDCAAGVITCELP
jgi:serine protease